MSDVDKTISGLNDCEHFHINQEQATTTTIKSDLPTRTSSFKYNSQHNRHQNFHPQHHQRHKQQEQQSLSYYKNNIAGSCVLTDSTVAETSAPAPSSLRPPSSSSSTRRNNCISRILKLIFSTPGLVLLVVAYSMLGALIFPLLEAPQDITKSAAIAKSREDCLRELWIITEKLNVLYERNWTMLVHEQLRRFEGSIVAATRNGGAAAMVAGSTHNTAIGRFGGSLDSWDQARWSFSEALLYSVTVITTIGHGNLTPKTAAGKIATILYALVGVPLMLMCLSSLGALLAEALQCTYARMCCRLAANQQEPNENGNGRLNNKNDGVKRQGHCSKENDNKKNLHENENECHGKGQGLNCKGCKYDAITGKTKMQQCYDYNDGNGDSALERGRTDESCRLLQSSPKIKTNHNNANSSCMQLKTMPQPHTVTLKPCYYKQKKKSAQPPDVMLAATPENTTETTIETTTATNISGSIATHSPQHLPHPLQSTTTFHIVSNDTTPQLISSTRSSPILYNRHQHQKLSHQHQLTMRQNLPQHFFAIPSNMVRFQVTPLVSSTSSSSSTQLLPNCYQPTASASVTAASSASATATGAATIYFPIAGATATMPRTSTSIVGASTSQLLCNQPLVKYHTIQLLHKKPPTITTTESTIAATTTTTLTNVLNGGQQRQQSTLSTSGTLSDSNDDTGPLNVADALPLPPPLAYQTATVHGVRRSKFIAKPMPPEINTLLAESDVNTTSFRHDLSKAEHQQSNATTMVGQTTTNFTPSTTIHKGDNVLLLSTGGSSNTTYSTTTTTSIPEANNLATAQGVESLASILVPATLISTTFNGNPTLTDSNVTVDIMEDEEDERLGNCPHGTPSRTPLLANSNDRCQDYDKAAHGLINATAASFNRHTLQRNGNRFNRKSTLVTHHEGGNLQTSAIWMRRSSAGGGCYGLDPDADTSEDDENFALSQFGNSANISTDDFTEDELEQYQNKMGPQVPISIVLLILVSYISLGTVIFALWENWSLIDGAYFCFVTLATIGYGDFMPERTFQGPEVQLFACCAYLLLGLVLVAMSFSILETQLMWKCKRIAVRLRLTKD